MTEPSSPSPSQPPTRSPGPPTPGHPPVQVIAHRGFSGEHPESTRAAYVAAIELARTSGRALQLECDVHFSADDQLVVLHDLGLQRTAGRGEAAATLTVAELKQIDFGSWRTPAATAEQRELITLAELLELVRTARADGVDVGLAIETKHPNPRGLQVDRRVLAQLAELGWDGPAAPVRMISFEPRAVELVGQLAPGLARSLLLERELGVWADGRLPPGIDTVGVDAALAARHPGWVEQTLRRGHRLHLWTVNAPADMAAWIERGATGLTTDHPDRALAVLHDRDHPPA